MDYPYTTISCRTGDGEGQATVTVQTSESGVDIDEGALVGLIRTYLAGMPGVTTTSATRYSVMPESISEA
ncbi:hypothetical protein [Streptomyces sp. SAJ15]|uniref:hypothetical protein n=1 Tax=Streptomyces sp. SAJ15 TaxID=2011095 RepID=UPI001187015B|nr:hypothetical protein [Streptomyces sp. SAJ15]TVL89732.1 hypothetical protein CD790_25365 [Streptomyces sp. SAJ15]